MNTSRRTWQARIAASDGCSLDLSQTDIRVLPEGTSVAFKLDLSHCHALRQLPTGLQAGSLVLEDCRSLESLPEGLNVSFLDISDCPQLSEWPHDGRIEAGRLRARNCVGLTTLPPWMKSISQLDLRGCANLSELPDWLQVASWIDVADTGIRELPPQLAAVSLRWKGVPVDQRIAFRPHEIHGREVLEVSNAELRRVMLARMGFERFLAEVEAETLDRDTDAGGERSLLRVKMPDDEPLVCVAVYCPSTGRQYTLRVPPTMATCHQAIAWTAGFEDPSQYQPLIET